MIRVKWLNTALLGCTGLIWSACGVSATVISVQTLLDKMQASPAVTASRYEEQRIDAELAQRQDSTSWSLFGGADAGRYRDLEQSGMQKYDGFGGQLGLRYPLLGAMQVRRAAVIDAKIALDQARYSTALTQAEQQQQLRQTYIDWWQQDAIARLCSAYQPLAAAELEAVATRTQRQQLRVSEKLWVEQRWGNLLRPCADVALRDARFRQQLSYFYGDIIPPATRPVSEPLPKQLAPVEGWLNLLNAHPALQAHRAEEIELEPLVQSRWSDRIDANFSISQRYDSRQDLSGSDGSTVAAINFEIPLTGLTSGHRRNPVASRYAAAQYRTEDTRHSLKEVLDQTLMQYQQRLDYLSDRRQQLKRMQQLVREQSARQNVDSEAGFMNLRLARVEQAETEYALVNDWHAAWSVLGQLQVLSIDALPGRSADLLHWTALSTELEEQPVSASRQSWSTAVYIWDSTVLLDAKQQSQQIDALVRAGFNHVYLGFNAAQVSKLELLRTDITQLIKQLKQRGFIVDLLLGEPLWVLDAHRNDMLDLIKKLAAQPFDHLHLDLEVEQLGWPVPDARMQGWRQTLEAAAQYSPWPVTLVSHHRWFAAEQRFAATCIPCVLPQLNISSATLMLYSTNESAVIARTRTILKEWPELRLHLAQSVEADLPAENSWSGLTPIELRALNTRFRNQLRSDGLTGIAWQAWEQYPQSGIEKH